MVVWPHPLLITSLSVADSVTRMAYHKYFHPKEALITNGILNKELARAAGKIDHTMETTQR